LLRVVGRVENGPRHKSRPKHASKDTAVRSQRCRYRLPGPEA
jgi:hypothetical protein